MDGAKYEGLRGDVCAACNASSNMQEDNMQEDKDEEYNEEGKEKEMCGRDISRIYLDPSLESHEIRYIVSRIMTAARWMCDVQLPGEWQQRLPPP